MSKEDKQTRMPYVFGSSTPRDFSYLDHNIPAKYRIYNVHIKAMQRKDEADQPQMSLKEILHEARRSASPLRGRRDRSLDSAAAFGGAGRVFVFGSSTPREWSYLERVPHEYRFVDAKLTPNGKQKRSMTTHAFELTKQPLNGYHHATNIDGVASTNDAGVAALAHAVRNNEKAGRVNQVRRSSSRSISSNENATELAPTRVHFDPEANLEPKSTPNRLGRPRNRTSRPRSVPATARYVNQQDHDRLSREMDKKAEEISAKLMRKNQQSRNEKTPKKTPDHPIKISSFKSATSRHSPEKFMKKPQLKDTEKIDSDFDAKGLITARCIVQSYMNDGLISYNDDMNNEKYTNKSSLEPEESHKIPIHDISASISGAGENGVIVSDKHAALHEIREQEQDVQKYTEAHILTSSIDIERTNEISSPLQELDSYSLDDHNILLPSENVHPDLAHEMIEGIDNLNNAIEQEHYGHNDDLKYGFDPEAAAQQNQLDHQHFATKVVRVGNHDDQFERFPESSDQNKIYEIDSTALLSENEPEVRIFKSLPPDVFIGIERKPIEVNIDETTNKIRFLNCLDSGLIELGSEKQEMLNDHLSDHANSDLQSINLHPPQMRDAVRNDFVDQNDSAVLTLPDAIKDQRNTESDDQDNLKSHNDSKSGIHTDQIMQPAASENKIEENSHPSPIVANPEMAYSEESYPNNIQFDGNQKNVDQHDSEINYDEIDEKAYNENQFYSNARIADIVKQTDNDHAFHVENQASQNQHAYDEVFRTVNNASRVLRKNEDLNEVNHSNIEIKIHKIEDGEYRTDDEYVNEAIFDQSSDVDITRSIENVTVVQTEDLSATDNGDINSNDEVIDKTAMNEVVDKKSSFEIFPENISVDEFSTDNFIPTDLIINADNFTEENITSVDFFHDKAKSHISTTAEEYIFNQAALDSTELANDKIVIVGSTELSKMKEENFTEISADALAREPSDQVSAYYEQVNQDSKSTLNGRSNDGHAFKIENASDHEVIGNKDKILEVESFGQIDTESMNFAGLEINRMDSMGRQDTINDSNNNTNNLKEIADYVASGIFGNIADDLRLNQTEEIINETKQVEFDKDNIVEQAEHLGTEINRVDEQEISHFYVSDNLPLSTENSALSDEMNKDDALLISDNENLQESNENISSFYKDKESSVPKIDQFKSHVEAISDTFESTESDYRQITPESTEKTRDLDEQTLFDEMIYVPENHDVNMAEKENESIIVENLELQQAESFNKFQEPTNISEASNSSLTLISSPMLIEYSASFPTMSANTNEEDTINYNDNILEHISQQSQEQFNSPNGQTIEGPITDENIPDDSPPGLFDRVSLLEHDHSNQQSEKTNSEQSFHDINREFRDDLQDYSTDSFNLKVDKNLPMQSGNKNAPEIIIGTLQLDDNETALTDDCPNLNEMVHPMEKLLTETKSDDLATFIEQQEADRSVTSSSKSIADSDSTEHDIVTDEQLVTMSERIDNDSPLSDIDYSNDYPAANNVYNADLIVNTEENTKSSSFGKILQQNHAADNSFATINGSNNLNANYNYDQAPEDSLAAIKSKNTIIEPELDKVSKTFENTTGSTVSSTTDNDADNNISATYSENEAELNSFLASLANTAILNGVNSLLYDTTSYVLLPNNDVDHWLHDPDIDTHLQQMPSVSSHFGSDVNISENPRSEESVSGSNYNKNSNLLDHHESLIAKGVEEKCNLDSDNINNNNSTVDLSYDTASLILIPSPDNHDKTELKSEIVRILEESVGSNAL